jgi:acetylornithine deacetylase/succinyl-diaminopimelate desuccinylase-like protein
MSTSVSDTVTALLQQLIRNQCVNDGQPESGEEVRSSDVLENYLEGVGLEIESFEPTPGRRSLVARLPGRDPSAPSLLLMGHTDVVPVTPSQWQRDPFGGELVADSDGQLEVWGRGAIDMLNITSSMAVAVRQLAVDGFRPRGDIVYLAVADEEAGGLHGAGWLVEHEWDAIGCDYVITESGGLVRRGAAGETVSLRVAEKGLAWRVLRVRGTPGHGSMPFGADNALVNAAEVVRRLAAYSPEPRLDELWEAFVKNVEWPEPLRSAALDPTRFHEMLNALDPRAAKLAHACTHTTFSPNVVHGGSKTNIIPDQVDIEVDIRTLPGDEDEEVRAHLRAALGELADGVEILRLPFPDASATRSPTDNELHDALGRVVEGFYPGATLLPTMTTGGTDARFFRAKGSIAYGFALFSPSVTFEDLSTRFHGVDERVDVESLRLSTEAWIALAHELG